MKRFHLTVFYIYLILYLYLLRGGNFLTDQEMFEAMQGYDEFMRTEEAHRKKKEQLILRQCRKIVGAKRYSLLLQDLEWHAEEGGIYLEGIVLESSVNSKFKQIEDDYIFTNYNYVNQSCGYTGDDFSGKIWIPLSGKKKKHRKCLEISFWC